jgi:hypothetical protein
MMIDRVSMLRLFGAVTGARGFLMGTWGQSIVCQWRQSIINYHGPRVCWHLACSPGAESYIMNKKGSSDVMCSSQYLRGQFKSACTVWHFSAGTAPLLFGIASQIVYFPCSCWDHSIASDQIVFIYALEVTERKRIVLQYRVGRPPGAVKMCLATIPQCTGVPGVGTLLYEIWSPSGEGNSLSILRGDELSVE